MKQITITIHRPQRRSIEERLERLKGRRDPDGIEERKTQARRFAAGVAWVSPWDRKVLLLKRGEDGPHPGTWCFPAGKIEQGETPAAAAIREFREESGCWQSPRDRCLMPVWDEGGFCLYLYQGSKFGPILDEESDDFMWASLDSPPSPLHPHVAEQLEAIREILNFNQVKVNK